MKDRNKKLLLQQLDKKIAPLKEMQKIPVPSKGWIYSIRTTLNISLAQLGKRLNITRQSARDIEMREAKGNITLNTLKETADALDMQLVYALVPKDESLKILIEKKASEIAKEIVMRTSQSMILEDKEVSCEKLQEYIKVKTEELMYEMPKYLWD